MLPNPEQVCFRAVIMATIILLNFEASGCYVTMRECCAGLTFTATTLTSDSLLCWPTNCCATARPLLRSLQMCVALSHLGGCHTHQGATLGIIRCLQPYVILLTQGFEKAWRHLQASTHQTSHTQTKYRQKVVHSCVIIVLWSLVCTQTHLEVLVCSREQKHNTWLFI